MKNTGIVYLNEEPVGVISKINTEYVFRYNDEYFANPTKKAISLTLPKIQQEYRATELFSFFFNMLSEGVNKKLQCRQLKIDENDFFNLLLEIGNKEVIGAVYVKAKIDESRY